MIVVDTETTGIDFRVNSLLSIGAIEFENPSNRFYAECKIFEGAHINERALEITGFTREDITDVSKMTDKELVCAFIEWTKSCKEITYVGENPSFDRDFIHETCRRYHLEFPFAYRTIDIHSLAYAKSLEEGIDVPIKNKHSGLNLDTTLHMVGLTTITRQHHNALEDSLLEAEAFSRLVYGKKLLAEYDVCEIPHYLIKNKKI